MIKKNEKPTAAATLGKPLLFGTLVGALSTLLLLFGEAALCVAVDVPVGLVSPMAFVTCAIGAFCGGFTAAKLAGKKGWLFGLLCGGCLFLLLSLVGFACVGETSGEHLILSLSLCLACGTCGGIVGVNLRRGKFTV